MTSGSERMRLRCQSISTNLTGAHVAGEVDMMLTRSWAECQMGPRLKWAIRKDIGSRAKKDEDQSRDGLGLGMMEHPTVDSFI